MHHFNHSSLQVLRTIEESQRPLREQLKRIELLKLATLGSSRALKKAMAPLRIMPHINVALIQSAADTDFAVDNDVRQLTTPVVPSSSVLEQRLDYRHYCHNEQWLYWEFAYLALEKQPPDYVGVSEADIERLKSSNSDLGKLIISLERSIQAGLLPKTGHPSEFVAWADRVRVSLPTEFEKTIDNFDFRLPRYGLIGTPNNAVVSCNLQLGSWLYVESSSNLTPIVQYGKPNSHGRFDARPFALLNFGLSVKHFGFNPKKSRNTSTSKIQNKLALAGLEWDRTTLLSYMRGGYCAANPWEEIREKSDDMASLSKTRFENLLSINRALLGIHYPIHRISLLKSIIERISQDLEGAGVKVENEAIRYVLEWKSPGS